MNKNYKKVAIIMGLFSFVGLLFGCSNTIDMDKVTEKYEEYEDIVKFSTYNQQQRQKYISDYLKEKYDVEYQVSEVKQRQITAIQNEEFYFATATNENDEMISVWVSSNGEITDSGFLLEMDEKITGIFESIIKSELTDVSIHVYTEMNSKPSKTWNSSDEVESMLESEGVYCIVRVFSESSKDITEQEVVALAGKLNFCNGCLYIHEVESVANFDYASYDLASYLYSVKFERR